MHSVLSSDISIPPVHRASLLVWTLLLGGLIVLSGCTSSRPPEERRAEQAQALGTWQYRVTGSPLLDRGSIQIEREGDRLLADRTRGRPIACHPSGRAPGPATGTSLGSGRPDGIAHRPGRGVRPLGGRPLPGHSRVDDLGRAGRSIGRPILPGSPSGPRHPHRPARGRQKAGLRSK